MFLKFASKMCKSCQYCLENLYWDCCEERFCFDANIAAYHLDPDDKMAARAYDNMGASLDSLPGAVVTSQPANNNHLPHLPQANGRKVDEEPYSRDATELPFNANAIYEVFSKSMIFRDELQSKPKPDLLQHLDDYETKSETDGDERPNRIVSFIDEVDSNEKLTDFEIMFQEELLGNHKMFKIEEEDVEDISDDNIKEECPEESGLTMTNIVKEVNLAQKMAVDVVPVPVMRKGGTNENVRPHTVHEYDPNSSIKKYEAPNRINPPKPENVKGILRVNSEKSLPRSFSARSLTRVDSSQKLFIKNPVNRVGSLKSIDTRNVNKLLSKLPQRSASFLSIPEHLLPETRTESVYTISSSNTERISGEFSQLSHMPDTPIIKSANLPKFFVDTPKLTEYKGEASLQSLKKPDDVIFTEYDYSMPRYYRKVASATESVPVHESKSMPDLRNPTSTGKVSKRLIKLRSRLKPLIIKKNEISK